MKSEPRESRVRRRKPVPPPPDPVPNGEDEGYIIIMDSETFLNQIRAARAAQKESSK